MIHIEDNACADAPLDEAGREAVRHLSLGIAAVALLCFLALVLAGFNPLTPEPLPECAVPVPPTTIKSTEIRV